jgi:hypothetical protein
MILVTGSELIEDARKAPDNVLSMLELSLEVHMIVACISLTHAHLKSQTLQLEYTLKLLNMDDQYQTDVIRSKLTRNIAGILEEIREELVKALDDVIQTRDDGAWSTYRRRGQ